MQAMKNSTKRKRFMFRMTVWGVVVFSLLMLLAGGVDVYFDLGWGFTRQDVTMALVVLIGAITVNLIGMKVFDIFGGT
jgi:hypothetical protein